MSATAQLIGGLTLLLASPASQPQALPLQNGADPRLGFSIDLPVPTHAEDCNTERCTLTHVLESGMGKLRIQLRRLPRMPGLEVLRQRSCRADSDRLIEAQRMPAGKLLQVCRRAGGQVELVFVVPRAPGALEARCTGPAAREADLRRICRSLRLL